MTNFQYCPCLLPLFFTGAACIALGIVTWRRQPAPGARWAAVSLFAVAEWTLGYGLELASVNLGPKMFWAKLEYVGIVLVPVAWFVFVLTYTGRMSELRPRTLAWLAVVPAGTLGLLYTNAAHHLLWQTTHLDTSSRITLLVPTYGAWFWIHTAYSYGLLVAGLLFLGRSVMGLPYLYRGQVAALLIGVSTPLLSNALSILDLSPVPYIDLTPFGFGVGSMAIAWALFRYGLLDVVPLARDRVIRNMADGILVLDARRRIVDLNPAAQRILDRPVDDLGGRPVQDVAPQYAHLVDRSYDGTEIHEEMNVRVRQTDYYFDVHATPLQDRYGDVSGYLITWHDVTARKRAEQDLQALNRTLESRVAARTADLVQTNDQLRTEIAERRRVERQLHRREQEFRALAENAPDIIIRADSEGRYVYINPVAEEVSGIPPETLLGQKTTELAVFPPVANLVRREFLQILETGREATFEFEFPAQDGPRWFHARVVPEFAPGGAIESVLGIARDITQRKRAEMEVEQRNRELTTLLDVSQRLAHRQDLDDLLDRIADAILDTLPAAESSSLWLYDEQQDELVIRAWAGQLVEDEYLTGLSIPTTVGIAGLVYRTSTPYLADDVAQEPVFEHIGPPKLSALRSLLGVPLLAGGQTIGVLFADNYSRTQAFGASDKRLLQALASHAAIAIQDAWLFGQVRASRQRLQDLSERLVEVQEVERRHVARELHDEVGQILTSLKLTLDMARQRSPDSLDGVLDEADTLVKTLTEQVRELSLDLRPAMLDDLGLLPALLWHVRRYTDHTQIGVDFKHMGVQDRRLPSNVETVAYRVVQEALTNVARHAGVDTVTVRVWTDEDTLNILVEDRGAGFDLATALDTAHTTGLASMRERTALVGGRLQIDSTAGEGTSVMATLPLSGYVERRESRTRRRAGDQ